MSSLSYAVNESATVIDIEQRRAEYMGNPQLDDGHTRIANELFEAILRSDLSSVQLKVALCVIRKTYGFNKKADRLAQSVIAEMTNVAKPNVCRAIKQLSKMKVVLVDTTKFPHEISINKRYKEWSNSYQSDNSYQVDSYQNDNEKVINSITKPLSIQQPQKKERKKERVTHEKRSLPNDFSVSESVRSWAEKNGYSQLDRHLDNFKDACLAKGYKYADWDAAFRNAIKGNWAKVKPNDADSNDIFAGAL